MWTSKWFFTKRRDIGDSFHFTQTFLLWPMKTVTLLFLTGYLFVVSNLIAQRQRFARWKSVIKKLDERPGIMNILKGDLKISSNSLVIFNFWALDRTTLTTSTSVVSKIAFVQLQDNYFRNWEMLWGVYEMQHSKMYINISGIKPLYLLTQLEAPYLHTHVHGTDG